MLVLARKQNQTIHIGNDVTVTIVRVGTNHVRVGIDAPKNTHVIRGELIVGNDAQPPLGGGDGGSLRTESGGPSGQ